MTADRLLPSFVDTNVFVYAATNDDPVRSPVAQNLVVNLAETEMLHTSTQVLQELYSVLTSKIRPRFSSERALDYLDRIAEAAIAQIDYSMIHFAAQLASRHHLSFWDGLIVAAARQSGTRRLYTEDLQHGQKVAGVEIVNPFR